MKRNILILTTLILLLTLCLKANAFCESFEYTGRHMNSPYASLEHTSMGHEFGYICNDCEYITILGYKPLSTCCECTNNHNVYVSSIGSHTSSGHLVTLKCSTCTYTSSYYESQDDCCLCVGHIPSQRQISNDHEEPRGHYYFIKCIECDEVIESGYLKKPNCDKCNCNHTYEMNIFDSHSYGAGHYYQELCSKCGEIRATGYTEKEDCCACRGEHYFEYYTDYFHSSLGHLYTVTCSFCDYSSSSYISLDNCCKCKGNHSFSAWSQVSSSHGPKGHLQSRKCIYCDLIEERYVEYRPCCVCHGHDMQQTANIGPHTDYGHLFTYRCIACGYEQEKYEELFGCPLCSNTPTNQEEFLLWAKHLGIPWKSINGNYVISFRMYRDYGYFVYGNPEDINPNPCVEGEYQYLGYTFEEDLFTNISYQNTQMGSNNANNWDYAYITGALESWEKMEAIIQKPYMLNTPLIGHGAIDFRAIDIGMDKTRVQSGATWASNGSIYTYKTNGFYATFKIPPMGNPNIVLNPAFTEEELVFAEGEIYKKAYVDISFSIDKEIREIDYIKLSIQGGESIVLGPNERSAVLSLNIPLQEAHEIKYTLRALIEVKSIFNDVYIKGEYCSVILKNPLREDLDGSGSQEEIPEIISDDPEDLPYIPEEENKYDISIGSIILKGAWNRWGLNERFLGLEEVSLDVNVYGRISKIEILFSQDLKSKVYIDGQGNVYDYATLTGSYERCPDDMVYQGLWTKGYSINKTYILPLCDTSLSKKDQRLKEAYKIIVRASNEKNSVERVYYVDITGNIYDYLHVQP